MKTAVEVIVAVGDAIREAGEIPSGTLYAILMDRLDLNSYETIIGTLVCAGLVRNSNHLLTWIGPPKEAIP